MAGLYVSTYRHGSLHNAPSARLSNVGEQKLLLNSESHTLRWSTCNRAYRLYVSANCRVSGRKDVRNSDRRYNNTFVRLSFVYFNRAMRAVSIPFVAHQLILRRVSFNTVRGVPITSVDINNYLQGKFAGPQRLSS